MQNIFDVFPKQFFTILTGKNRIVYSEALLILYEQSKLNRFGTELDNLRTYYQELFLMHLQAGVVFDEEEDGELIDVTTEVNLEQTNDTISRLASNAFIRKLSQLEWIQIETREQFKQYVMLPHYTSRLLELFEQLCEARPIEYQRFAFLTYDLLKSDEVNRRPYFVIQEAVKQTKQLETELITLYQNMKHHMEIIMAQTTLKGVLEQHFDIYKERILDASYHRLKTSDHVSRYRMHILSKVQNWIFDEELFKKTILEAMHDDNVSEAEARIIIYDLLKEIEKTYIDFEEIINKIDLRQSQYVHASYERARYLTQRNDLLEYQIANLLKSINYLDEKKLLSSLFTLQEVEFIENQSFYSPRTKRPPRIQYKHEIPVKDTYVREAHKQEVLKKLQSRITAKKVNEFILQQLADMESLELKDFSIQTIDQYIMLPFINLYGDKKEVRYIIKRKYPQEIVRAGAYRFSNHVIYKK